ncbi:MAG TPA: hypothetical protein PKK43_12215, partial [Spirochaetota bacterium]|nr:hypothetical protein [Spirochaetota bacterium]
MMKKRIFIAGVFGIALIGAVVFLTCRANAGGFLNNGESPLLKSQEEAKAWEIQKVFRDIYDLYEDRVVFISTEQTVKIPQ